MIYTFMMVLCLGFSLEMYAAEKQDIDKLQSDSLICDKFVDKHVKKAFSYYMKFGDILAKNNKTDAENKIIADAYKARGYDK